MVKSNNPVVGLSDNVMIEVIRIRAGEPTVKKEMTVKQWNELIKTPGYIYRAYQLGFSSYPEIEQKK